MSALNAALCRRGIILWLAAVLLLASRSTHSAPVYDQDTTQIAEYDGVTAGCYFNYQRYQEGDRIMTSEPCLNCTCHNRMLMCYLKVCPFTKAIGQDCTVEKRPDQCCPVITCPEVPVQLLTSTSAPATSDSTEVGFHDNYGCHVNERFYADGAMLPLDHHNPCELCYCIRNRTTCVMQECTLRVAGCKPVYQPGVCCPIKYNCEYDEEPSTTVGSTPGLIMTTTLPPGVLPQCHYEGKVYEDGDLIYSTQPCQHCYCFGGEIACAVQNCGTPMQEHGKNCTALPPPEGECCPTTYQCGEEEGITTFFTEEEGITTLRGEEQLPEQVPRDQTTESPIGQEDQVKEEHPQEVTFPGFDNNIPQEGEEENNTQGIIEHITQGYVPSTEKTEQQPVTLPAEEIETTTVEKEFIPSHEHLTETSPVEITSEETGATKVPSEIETEKPEAPTTVQEIEGLVTEVPSTELPETSSVAEHLQPDEATEHVSTEENIIEEEHDTFVTTEKEHDIFVTTEKEQSIEPSISEATQTEGPKELETTSPHEELSTQKEITEVEKTTEEEQINVTKMPETPEISTEIIEKTSSTEEPSISTVTESVSEQPKEDESKPETMPDEFLATQTESPKEEEIVTIAHEISSTEQIITEKEEEIVTVAHEISSTEQIITEKEEVSYSTEAAVTEQIQSTEVSPKEQPSEEQKPITSEGEKEQRPEETTSEHTIEKQVPIGAKKEDAGLTESPVINEESVTKEPHVQQESTPEIPVQGPTGIPIPERSPEQKAEDESVYHVTEDYGITHPEIIPDNLITESPQKVPTTYFPEQETTLASSEETIKPIVTEGTEVSTEEITKPMLEQVTEINLPTQSEPEIITVSEETKTESIPAVIEVEASTEFSTTTIVQKIPEEEAPEKSTSVPEETETKLPQMEIQLTEKTPSGEEMSTKEFEESSESTSEKISGEKGEKEVQPKKEEGIEMQPPMATEPPETHTFIPTEHSTMPSDLGKEHATEGDHVTTIIPSEQSTHVPTQVEEKVTEIVPVEKEEPVTKKPVEERVTEHPITAPGITDEKEKELQTDEPVLKEEQTTETIKKIEAEEKPTMLIPTVEEGITEQYSTEKALEEETVTTSHGPEEIEYTTGVSTESADHHTAITEKEPSEETVLNPDELFTSVGQTELPEHPTEATEIEKEGEQKISVPVSTEETQTEISVSETGATETIAIQTEKVQTEPSVSGEYIPSQPSIPSDRKEDQEPIEPELEEQITQKPEKEITEITEMYEEPQKSTVPSEEEIPLSEGVVTESILPEEKPAESSTMKSDDVMPEQTEISSEQPEKVVTELPGQEEQTQESITEQLEMHDEKEIETSSFATHEGSSVTPEIPEKPTDENVDISKATETVESGSTVPVLISEASTEFPGFEEPTKHEVPIEKEITPVTEIISSEKEQPEIQEQVTQPSIKEETSKEKDEAEISTVEDIISKTTEVPITKEQPQKPDEEEIIQETGITDMPEHEEKEEYSTVAPKEIPEIITTEILPKEVSEYTTNIPEETSVEGESTSEITLPKEVSEYTTNIPEEISVEGESTSEIALRPSGIPGEGNCLVEGQSYGNNSAVPPANDCQTSCRCISSIVQCELVQCPAPPAHLLNCMPVHTESCCPIYACDSTPNTELESDSHVIEPHIPGTEEESQKTVPPTEMSTEGVTESNTLSGEISSPESPVEITVTPSEEKIAIERQQTTLKPIETVYEQPTTVKKPIEKYPEEHTISPVFETSQESASQIPEEHTMLGETTESKVNQEGITESVASTEQPQEEIGEKQTTVSDIITSTHVSMEQESQGTEKTVSMTTQEETSIPVEVEEVSIPVEKEEVTTIAAGKDEEIIPPVKEQEEPTEEEGIKEQSTLKPIEEIEKEQPEEEKVPLKPTSEEPVIPEEHETFTKPEEIVTEKSEIPEEQKTIKPTEYTSIPEIQSTTEYKSETGYKEEKEQETVTTETAQTEELENQTKLPEISPSEIETQKPAVESTTLIHDHTINEGTPIEEHTTIKSVEVPTEESTKIELEISTQAPVIEEEHVTIPIEAESPSEETTKLVEESTEVSHEAILPETTESAIEKDTTEHEEVSHEAILPETTESAIEKDTTEHEEEKHAEHEEESSATLSPEEKPSETESSVNIEEPAKTTETVVEHEKPTETSVIQEPESTQISIEKHSEATPEIESHTSELPIEEHTTAEEISTTSASGEEAAEQATTSIIKETEPNLSELSTKQPVISESETSEEVIEEHVTTPVEEQTPKSEESPVEEQTIASPSSSEENIIEGGVSTEVPILITSPEAQTTEKAIENVKPETQLPDLAEEHTIIPEISKKDEEQKPEIGITEEPSKEEPTTISEITEADKKEMEEAVKEEAVTTASTTEYKPEEIDSDFVKIQEPIEAITPKEPKPEKDSQVTEASLPEHPESEEATTVASLKPEEHTVVPVKTEEEQGTHEPEYQTTLSIVEEEVSKSTTETSEVEKLPSEEETESTEQPEEPVTKLEVSSTEKPAELPSETEKPAKSEQETEPTEGETTTKIIESAVTKETLPEEVVPVEVIPKVEEKPIEVSTIGEEEEAHFTEPTYSVETTSVHEEEQPSITELQPTERPLTSEEEIQPTQPEEGEKTHPTTSEESHPSIAEEPQFTTEHAPEEPITIKIEEQPETSSEAVTVEGPIKISNVQPSELPEEIATVEPIVPGESESQIPIKPEESPQPETPIEEPVIKTQPLSTELPTGEITEETPEEESIHPQEGEGHPHIDHFPETTVKPEIDYNSQRPATTLAPHIPEYPDQTGISGEDTHVPMPGGSYPNPDDDYGEEDYGGPGTCRYGGKVYVSAQQIPRDDPCDFCFCFRSDIICLQQSCPPPIPGCHEEPISGFCCPRYECPVSMATALNLTTTTTTTTTTLPPHFHAHAYKGAARRSGCQVRGQAYRVGEVIKSASGPCLRCICGGDGNMNCDPRVCSPEPMLRQMIAATTDAKRRR